MTQCASAVALSHVHGIVHSDIAVWNVLHEPNDDIYKVGDFGLLKIVSSDLISAPSRSLLIGGRAAFLPPYARSDPSKIGRGSDVYAMAVMYWHLLEGERVLGHGDVVPGVVRVTAESRDAPAQVRQLLSRFIERHEEEDSVSDFLEFLGRVPTR
jgi:serine/threonine protein kinase